MAVEQRLWLTILVSLGTVTAAPTDSLEPFNITDYINSRFVVDSFVGTWMSDTLLRYTNTSGNDVVLYDIITDSVSVLLSGDVLDSYDSGAFHSYSPNGQLVAISYDSQKVYRHSSTARYTIYDIYNKASQSVADGEAIQTLLWAGTNSILWVMDENVYYRRDAMTSGADIQITSTGESGVFFNGVPDWVYEEEVLASDSAMWPSTDGSMLAFAAFNDINVNHTFYFNYGEPGANGTQYPEVVDITYPQVGTDNPDVILMVVNLHNASATGAVNIINITAPDEVTESHILYGCNWSGERLLVSWQNRVQNLSIISSCDTSTGSCFKALSLSETDGWVDPPVLTMHSTGQRAATVLPNADRPHLAVVTFHTDGSNADVVFLTEGNITVISVLGWDEARGYLYYMQTEAKDPAMRHVYRIVAPDEGASESTAEPECLTCSIESPEGNLCTYGDATLSTNFTYGALLCYGPDPAFYALYNLQDAGGPTLVRDWEKNEAIRKALSQKKRPELLDLWKPVAGGFSARVRLLLPPDMDKSGSTKYPLLVYVYGGPDYNLVTTEFQMLFNDYLTSARGIVTALIDGRGSGLNGRKFLHSVYRNLGTVEIEDQISVTKILQEELPFVDSTRTAIWGWSYGGFSTAHAMARDTGGVFCCGISVAPVSSFIYYDTIYTERYMGLPTPEDNLGGYNGTDVTRRVENIRYKKYLLLHGNADDNVHYQNSMALSRALEEADILFQQQSYPNEAHSLSGVSSHVYRTMDDFWTRVFDLPEPAWKTD